jgi:5-methylcytosine-specific restriction endonuclease McrA
MPQSRGGSSQKNNLVPCCFRCNQMKSNLTQAEFLSHLKRVIETMSRKVIQPGEEMKWPIDCVSSAYRLNCA